MAKRLLGGWVMLCLAGFLVGNHQSACTSTGGGKENPTDGGSKDGGPSESGGSPKWYYTCGDPVCRGYSQPQGISACTTQKAGNACTNEGEKCDPKDNCNRLVICAKSDPTKQQGGCPISSRAWKQDIRYLDDAKRRRIHRELMQLRLATYRYSFESKHTTKHIGFMIEDHPNSAAVDRQRKIVSLYDYTSMTIASMQTQAQQLSLQTKLLKAQQQQLRILQTQVHKLETQLQRITQRCASAQKRN